MIFILSITKIKLFSKFGKGTKNFSFHKLYQQPFQELPVKSFPTPLSPSEEAIYIQKYQDGDQEARNILIEHNLRLVTHVLKKYHFSESEQEDIISIGTIGLIKAVMTFKPDKGNRLATYAARCIENAILPQMRLLFQTSIGMKKKPFARFMGIEPNLLQAWEADQKRMNINSWNKYFKGKIKA